MVTSSNPKTECPFLSRRHAGEKNVLEVLRSTLAIGHCGHALIYPSSILVEQFLWGPLNWTQ
jgi:hypothetical protein